MRLVARDRVRDVLERVEPVRLLVHEGLDPGDPFGLHARRDVDHHERRRVDMILADRDEARAAAHRSAHQRGPGIAERADDAHQVLDHRVLAVAAVGCPAGIAMTARIECDRAIARAAELRTDALPCVAGLPAAVLQDDERAAGIAPFVAGERDAVRTRPEARRIRSAGKPLACAHSVNEWLSPRRTGVPHSSTDSMRATSAGSSVCTTARASSTSTTATPRGGLPRS